VPRLVVAAAPIRIVRGEAYRHSEVLLQRVRVHAVVLVEEGRELAAHHKVAGHLGRRGGEDWKLPEP